MNAMKRISVKKNGRKCEALMFAGWLLLLRPLESAAGFWRGEGLLTE